MKGKKILSLVLVMSILCSLIVALPVTAGAATSEIWDGTVATGFGGGTGTEQDPYQIYNGSQLAYLAEMTNKGELYNEHFVLMNDIVLNDTEYWHPQIFEPKNIWIPIGYEYAFIGTFDGNGHTVKGIFTYEDEKQGLFGWSGGTIKNVGVLDSYIIGDIDVGGVVGNNYGGIVSNCYNMGTVTGTLRSVGGVVGNNYAGIVSNCYNEGNIEGYEEVGGVIGYNSLGFFKNCYNTGNITGSEDVGGVVGYSNSIATSCFNSGDITGGKFVGGVVGYNTGTLTSSYNTGYVKAGGTVGGVIGYGGRIIGCYNVGSVSGDLYVGGVAGHRNGKIMNCYYLSDCAKDKIKTIQYGVGSDTTGKSTPDTIGRTTGLTESQLKQQSSFEEFDFQNLWTIEPGTGYAYPQFMRNLNKLYGGASAIWNGDIAIGFESGTGTDTDPYIIKTAEQLAYLAKTVNSGTNYRNKYIMLANDIILNDTTKKNWILNATPWIPIGNADNIFYGIFDGNGYAVKGIYINSVYDYQGLFGFSDGVIKNTVVSDSCIYGEMYTGGVVGYNDGIITSVSISNIGGMNSCITGSKYTGGVIGYSHGYVENCYNTGNVTGYSWTGGITGCVAYQIGIKVKSDISSCYNTGSVTGYNNVGGIAGENNDLLKNCYNTGSVTGLGQVGGIAGENYRNSNTVYPSIVNCYNIGNVLGSSSSGGIVGLNYYTVKDCYYASDITQKGIGEAAIGSTSSGIAIGLTDEQMKQQTSFDGFDFATLWTMAGNPDYPYPELIGMYHGGEPAIHTEFDKSGETINISIKTENIPESAKIYFASYAESGKLKEIKEATLIKNSASAQMLPIEVNKIKVFAWADNLIPYTDNCEWDVK